MTVRTILKGAILVTFVAVAFATLAKRSHARRKQRRRDSDAREDDDSKEMRDFYLALQFVETNISAIPDDGKLRLYGFFKEVTEGPFAEYGPPISLSPFDFVGRAKRAAWKAASEEGVDPRLGYVQIVAAFDPDWRAKCQSMSFGGCLRPMTLQDDSILPDDSAIGKLCETVAHGAVEEVNSVLRETPALLIATDVDRMTVLHWACDRGNATMCVFLLDLAASRMTSVELKDWVNAQDNIGMTALHYTVTNEHEAIVPLLLKRGADVNIADEDGSTPLQLSVGTAIEALIQ